MLRATRRSMSLLTKPDNSWPLIPGSHSAIAYSNPDPADRPGNDFDVQGHWDLASLEKLAIPVAADFYVCGPLHLPDGYEPRSHLFGRAARSDTSGSVRTRGQHSSQV